MKKFVYVMASVSLAALMSLTACKKDNKGDNTFKLNTNANEITAGEEFTLTASNYDGEVNWSVEPEGIVTLSATTGASVTVKGVKAGTCKVKATNGNAAAYCEVTVTGAEKEAKPEIKAPAAGSVTIAVRVPLTTDFNKGLYGIGSFSIGGGEPIGWDHNKAAENAAFKLVEGTKTWFSLTIDTNEFGGLKVCAVPSEGDKDWKYQWGMNTDDKTNVSLVVEDASVTFELENGGEVKLAAVPDAAVVYIDIDEWKTAPAKPVNPAGPAKFSVKLGVDNVKGAKVVGNWAEDSEYGSWATDKGLALTEADGSWSASAEVPAGFQFKILLDLTGEGTYTWDSPSLKSNQDMSLDLNFVKEYTLEDWDKLPVE